APTQIYPLSLHDALPIYRATREGRRLRLRVQLRSFDAICRLVEAGVGVGIVPATTAHRAARTTAISIVPLLDAWAQRDLRVCLRSEEHTSELQSRRDLVC